jgi:hypothetical protein
VRGERRERDRLDSDPALVEEPQQVVDLLLLYLLILRFTP